MKSSFRKYLIRFFKEDWKKNKTLNLKKIKDLEFDLKKIASENNG